MSELLKPILANKHTSGAAAVALICFMASVGCTWFPSKCEQIKATSAAAEKLAIVYGLAMASDGKDKSKTETDPTDPTK